MTISASGTLFAVPSQPELQLKQIGTLWVANLNAVTQGKTKDAARSFSTWSLSIFGTKEELETLAPKLSPGTIFYARHYSIKTRFLSGEKGPVIASLSMAISNLEILSKPVWHKPADKE